MDSCILPWNCFCFFHFTLEVFFALSFYPVSFTFSRDQRCIIAFASKTKQKKHPKKRNKKASPATRPRPPSPLRSSSRPCSASSPGGLILSLGGSESRSTKTPPRTLSGPSTPARRCAGKRKQEKEREEEEKKRKEEKGVASSRPTPATRSAPACCQ